MTRLSEPLAFVASAAIAGIIAGFFTASIPARPEIAIYGISLAFIFFILLRLLRRF